MSNKRNNAIERAIEVEEKNKEPIKKNDQTRIKTKWMF
jgi:hypothetical protein